MNDRDVVLFLRWALPALGMRWAGFRKVRRQVGKRLRRRIDHLGLAGFAAYRDFLERRPEEWKMLDGLCRVTISRFFRDRGVFSQLEQEVIPAVCEGALARQAGVLEVWSIGCASGEEPYSVALLWDLRLQPRFAELGLRVLGTDADPTLIARACAGAYASSSLEDLPPGWKDKAFVREANSWRLRERYRSPVRFELQDVRTSRPAGPFDLVLCRNLVFTYFDTALQERIAGSIRASLCVGGALVVGSHERLPQTATGFSDWPNVRGVYRRT